MNAFRRLLVFLAGLMGAAGVAAAAAGAHLTAEPNLTTAATFLMLGASAVVGGCALAVVRGPGWSFASVGAGIIALGTVLFSGALALRALWDIVVFPMAAPIGGTMLILGWLVLALAAIEREPRAG
ncbi:MULTISPECIES: DUF423 domain-containing protein [Ancylobacter]|jgi:uncharacterized membrane protein YgdD (TMEM256/DUF423 family)|uniref:Uncharacterized membrane protein YgdD (TMEM256/DUF423 family) n=1 Tax=Ancylobacter vacuolatus TaxID=223389 RepID=A0ABU0DIG6_9HYPH|nr:MULTISPECIES: DUF423 domain-containing protein [Ancylobacter]MDQ0348216.1 uncharacterized membrane protein YgdD (TMEM256/DUF423 family) [Ancylobacter vacuolatus]RTL96943.1 DUF423 domain-containing protein [Ancylobacter aquaticus]